MKELLGGCFLAVGILITGLTGLCSLLFVSGIREWQDVVDIFSFAGIPFVIGFGLIFIGRAVIRSAREDRYRS
jgi:CHASE2 domain-containing sensor protein